jgi:endonuclease-3
MSFSIKANRERAAEILPRLEQAYPDARCSLDYATPLDLLVATILAAQCTDERVNIVTKSLFRKYRSPEDYVNTPREELEEAVRTCGFFRQKAKSIVNACRRTIEVYDGKVPDTMETLVTLDGVGRKTANVLLGECFGTDGIIVDTHVGRISRRLKFTRQEDPVKVEQDLMKILPRESWTQFSHCLVFHGRRTCIARKPKCEACPISDLCPYPPSRKEA